MNGIDEFSRIRVTLGYAAEHYGFEVVPEFATGVTITSLADDIHHVRPGALFIPCGHVDRRQLEAARDAGAYAALVPCEFRNEAETLGMPLLISSYNPVMLGQLASDVNADPSGCVATFGVAGDDDDEIHANVLRLADFLHMLGNPVGIFSDAGSTSLQRDLAITYPMSVSDVHHYLSVCVEDGATAIVIALNSATLKKDALQAVTLDVVGAESHQDDTNMDTSSSLQYAANRSVSLNADSRYTMPSDAFLHENEDDVSSTGVFDDLSNSAAKLDTNTDTTATSTVETNGDQHVQVNTSDISGSERSLTADSALVSRPVHSVVSFYELQQRYGFTCNERAYCVNRTKESDELAIVADQIGTSSVRRHLSLAIAMVLAAGVRRGAIKSALRVSRELC